LENIYLANDDASRKRRAQISYSTALRGKQNIHRLARISWMTWIITFGTFAVWCVTAYQVALQAGAHSFRNILANVLSNAQNADVLIAYGAKDNSAIVAGQYWRFVTPIFLHANVLHVALNMLNLFVLGLFIERLIGHVRFLFIYLVTGIISVIASFYFAPQEISIGASGAIFGLVGAYSIFVLAHRRAFRRGGIPVLLWLVIVIGINLSIGFFVPDVDNYAHIGGLVSGCLLGCWFMPLYRPVPGTGSTQLTDVHSLTRRWPLALSTLIVTVVLALLAVHFVGG
jgi:membrane associated rhomboid family serine protease